MPCKHYALVTGYFLNVSQQGPSKVPRLFLMARGILMANLTDDCPNFLLKRLRKLQLLQLYGCLALLWRYRQLYVKRDEHDILTNFWQLLLLLSNMCHSTKKEIILHKWMWCSMATVLYTLFFKLTQDWDCPSLKLDFLSSWWQTSFSPHSQSYISQVL